LISGKIYFAGNRYVIILYLLIIWSGCGRDSHQPGNWPFFAICQDTHDTKNRTLEQQAALLKDLGYAGCGHLQLPEVEQRAKTLADAGLRLFQVYITIDLSKSQPVDMAELVKILPVLQPHQSHLTLMINGGTPSDSSMDNNALFVIKDIIAASEPYKIKIILYPHYRFWLETCADAVRLAEKINLPDEVGVMFNLSHWMRCDPERNMRAVLDKAKPWLMAVSLNGSDSAHEVYANKGKWILPLDQGSGEVGKLIENLKQIKFTGLVGLQCWGIRDDARVTLEKSISEWNRLVSTKGTQR